MMDFDKSKWIIDKHDLKPIRNNSGRRDNIYLQQSTSCKCFEKRSRDDLVNPEMQISFNRELSILATCKHPAIVPFVGFYEKKYFGFIFTKLIENGGLNDFLFNKRKKSPHLNDTQKLIISYGIACAMEYIHDKQIIHRNLSISHVLLNSDFHPFITGFSDSITSESIETLKDIENINAHISYHILAPELLDDSYHENISFENDVYAYGITLYELFSELIPFPLCKSFLQFISIVSSGEKPVIPDSVPSNWQKLINDCLDYAPSDRPTFTEICNLLESDTFVNDKIDRKVFEEYKKLVKPFRPSTKDKNHELEKDKDHPSDKKVASIQSELDLYKKKIDDLTKELEKVKSSSFNPFKETEAELQSNDNYFIGSDDEKFYKTVKKIGEGITSIVYKIIDTRNDQVLCKKVLKIVDETSSFNNAKNALKEFEVLHAIRHPCICKAIGINTSEPIQNEAEELTTISLYLEFLNRSLKDSIDKNVLDNTLKVRIVIEIVHALNFIHKLGLIHRDIKIENIMLNSAFEAKIVDFKLVRIDECFNGQNFVTTSMTKGIGTMSYMSPEMINEEDYDSKTDVYSFGIVLHYLFTGKLPSINMKDKMNGKQIPLPNPSSSISQFGIDLISKCTDIKPSKRPSFEDILNEIRDKSYSLAPEIEKSIISKRDRELSFFEIQSK